VWSAPQSSRTFLPREDPALEARFARFKDALESAIRGRRHVADGA
jgi:hypothetical protein